MNDILIQKTPGEPDFILSPNVQSCWIEVDGIKLWIRRPTGDLGVVVEAFETSDEYTAYIPNLDELVIYEYQIAEIKANRS